MKTGAWRNGCPADRSRADRGEERAVERVGQECGPGSQRRGHREQAERDRLMRVLEHEEIGRAHV